MKTKYNYYVFFIFSLIIFFAFIKGFRMPNLWSINYYLPNFFDGFYRRSLPGTILIPLGDLRFNYYTIIFIQFSILFSLLIWIYYLFQKNTLLILVISLYLLSPAGAYLFHEVGYIDQLLYLILFISIATFKKYKIFSLIFFSSSMFIHELTVFTTLPIFFTYIYLSTNNLKESILYTLPSIIFFITIYFFFQTVPSESINLFIKEISSSSNYILRSDFYTIFENTFIGRRNKIYYNINSLNPIFLLFSVTSLTSIMVYKISKQKIILSILVFLTGISPLALGFFGWDVHRWYFLSISSLTVVFIIVLLNYKTTLISIASTQLMVILYFIFYILLISNLHLEYYDGYKPRYINIKSLIELRHEFGKIPNR